jgi:hypothetical protein
MTSECPMHRVACSCAWEASDAGAGAVLDALVNHQREIEARNLSGD